MRARGQSSPRSSMPQASKLSAPSPETKSRAHAAIDQLWSSSSLVPFIETPEYKAVHEWALHWSFEQPACILYGPTSSGKSRIIEEISAQMMLHTVEIDCSSASGVKECFATAEEATKSHSVGAFLTPGQFTSFSKSSSMVVFECIDFLANHHSCIPPSIVSLVSSSRVPIYMTAYANAFPPSPWLFAVQCFRPPNPFSILKASSWMKGFIHSIDVPQRLQTLLHQTNGDIRRCSIQFQFSPNDGSFLNRKERLFLSIPVVVSDISKNKKQKEMYSLLCDCIESVGEDEQLLDKYLRPCCTRLFSESREIEFKEMYKTAATKIPHTVSGPFEKIEIPTVAKVACSNPHDITRNRMGISLGAGHTIQSSEIHEIANWALWPNASRDLPNCTDK